MTAGRLLRYRTLALTRALAGPRTGGGALVALVALGAVLATLWTLSRWALEDLEGGPQLLQAHLGDRVFWLAALPALVYAYTTFEVIFRAPDRTFIGLHPVDGRVRWLDLQVRAYLLHLPLLVPALGYGGGLITAGASLAGARVLSVVVLTYIVGIALSSWLHLMAGRTMLRVSTPLSRALSGGVIDDEASLILYAPAGGLALTLVLVVFIDLFAARTMVPSGPIDMYVLLSLGLLASAVWMTRRAAHDAQGYLTLVSSRFEEVDTPLPYREDGNPETCPGEEWAKHLERSAAALFLRDLKQLRRRHRVDKVLLWIFAALALRAGLGHQGPDDALIWELLGLYIGFVGLFWTNAFRVWGDELGSPWLERTLPLTDAPKLKSALLVDLSYPAWALLSTLGASLLAGAWLTTLMLALAGGLFSLSNALLSRSFARLMNEHQRAASIAWRASVIVLIALLPGGSP